MTTEEVKPAITVPTFGKFTGQCKWWSNRLNYGFITVCSDEDNMKGIDVFCHHSGIIPLNSKYRTLRKGEYINFNLVDGPKGKQAVHVTGILGGPLMCDVSPITPKPDVPMQSPQNAGMIPKMMMPFMYPHPSMLHPAFRGPVRA